MDDFIEDRAGDAYARWMFAHFRLPAALRLAFDPFMEGRRLFCTWQGRRFRVTGASRLGDVWLAEDLSRDTGYDHRVDLEECSGWGPDP